MSLIKYFYDRLTTRRSFFYGWEQRSFERRQEQTQLGVHLSCRVGRD